jgi:class 3 adenylate cyclase
VSELPTGTVTLLFTDIEGSTRLLQKLGEAYAQSLEDHRRILRGVFQENRGIEVDTQGDAFSSSSPMLATPLVQPPMGSELLPSTPGLRACP